MSPPMNSEADQTRIAYQLPQPTGMLSEIFVSGALKLDDDPESWIPQAEGVWFRPLILSVSQGYYINLLKVRGAGMLSRHRHSGPVHAFTLKGTWHYLEHDWVASAGDYAFEPAGETHTLIVPEGQGEMITLFHVTGGYTYVDTQGVALGYEDVFTKLDKALAHYRTLGLDKSFIEQFVR